MGRPKYDLRINNINIHHERQSRKDVGEARWKKRGGGRTRQGRKNPQGGLRCLLDWRTDPMTPPSQPSQLWNCQPPSAAGSPYGLRSKNRTLSLSLRVLGLLLLLAPFPKTPTRREQNYQTVYRKEKWQSSWRLDKHGDLYSKAGGSCLILAGSFFWSQYPMQYFKSYELISTT